MQRIIWLIILIATLFLIDWYVFQGLRQIIGKFEPITQKWIKVAYWSLPVISLLSFIYIFYISPGENRAGWKMFVITGIFIIYISKLLTTAVLFIAEIVRAIQWSIQKLTPKTELALGEKITRSQFITQGALALGALHVGAMTYGIISGAHDYRVKRIKIPIKDLPRAFEGLKIAQVSDIHSGSFYNKTAVQGGVDMLLAEKPDIAFFTGDLVNNKAEEFKDHFDTFKQIQAPLGVYSTLGNHDYGDYTQWKSQETKIQNLNDLKEAHKLMGWKLMMDENELLKIDNETLAILGIQNWGAGGFAKYGDLKKAIVGTEDVSTRLLLSHDPSHWREQVLGKTQIDASFAGHTHGMQYGVEIGDFKWSPVQYRYKEWAGLYTENNQNLYVNRGYGYIGYPGRLGILPEITIAELTKA